MQPFSAQFPMPNNILLEQSAPWARLLKIGEAQRSATRASLAPRRVITGHACYDYSYQGLEDGTLSTLMDLASALRVEEQRDALFSGAIINRSENRPALHTALRRNTPFSLLIGSEDVGESVAKTRARMRDISTEVQKSASITDIVHIGIGGSELGPRLVYNALKDSYPGAKTLRFVANIDPLALERALHGLDPRHTLVLVVSKTFGTLETLANARRAKDWLGKFTNHLFALTGNTKAAQDFGIADQNILPIPEWVGGRYSVWSAAGFCLSLTFGHNVFEDLLHGATLADAHFCTAPPEQNIPVLMALITLWNRSVLGRGALAILPYDERLADFPAYFRQMEMESNGKGVGQDGRALTCASAPVVFGDVGTNGQHAFYQMLHQGQDIIPAEFILCAKVPGDAKARTALHANALAQAEALWVGESHPSALHKHCPGGRPSSILILPDLSPLTAGYLLALHEHRVFVEGALWGINSFDQWGVELGKKRAQAIMEEKNGRSSLTKSLLGIIENFDAH